MSAVRIKQTFLVIIKTARAFRNSRNRAMRFDFLNKLCHKNENHQLAGRIEDMTPPSNEPDKIVAEVRRLREQREKTYRERALKLFPHVCAKCGREFSGKRLRELTVHHKDHNHDNNPPDGSNWELLCLYCHENEHSRYLDAEWTAGSAPENEAAPSSLGSPFAGLNNLLKNKQ